MKTRFGFGLLACASLAIHALGERVRTLLVHPLEGDLANAAFIGTHATGRIPFKSDGAIARGLLVKAGSDAAHIVVATAADTPTFVTTDEQAAAELTITCEHLVNTPGTKRFFSDGSAAIAVDDFLVPAAGGKVKKLPTASGTYWLVGRSRSVVANGATGDDQELEAETFVGWKVVP